MLKTHISLEPHYLVSLAWLWDAQTHAEKELLLFYKGQGTNKCSSRKSIRLQRPLSGSSAKLRAEMGQRETICAFVRGRVRVFELGGLLSVLYFSLIVSRCETQHPLLHCISCQVEFVPSSSFFFHFVVSSFKSMGGCGYGKGVVKLHSKSCWVEIIQIF